MKTLVIHPKDSSTSFLDVVYNSIENKTVIDGGINKTTLMELIKSHDRIMMMGHGSPQGLFSVGKFPDTYPFIIDEDIVPLLKTKKDNVFIWCNSDWFVEKHNLKGFYTGMFISEVSEAHYCGLPGTTQDIVDESNYGFCEIVAKHINEETELLYENVISDYTLIAETNPVALYNNLRLYEK